MRKWTKDPRKIGNKVTYMSVIILAFCLETVSRLWHGGMAYLQISDFKLRAQENKGNRFWQSTRDRKIPGKSTKHLQRTPSIILKRIYGCTPWGYYLRVPETTPSLGGITSGIHRCWMPLMKGKVVIHQTCLSTG